ncbi:FHA domain-containing protein, partial [Streptomyces sp. MCAF7]
HATVRWGGRSWVIEDHGSTNGTYVQGQRVQQMEIGPGSTVHLGNATDGPRLILSAGGAGAAGAPGVAAGAYSAPSAMGAPQAPHQQAPHQQAPHQQAPHQQAPHQQPPYQQPGAPAWP